MDLGYLALSQIRDLNNQEDYDMINIDKIMYNLFDTFYQIINNSIWLIHDNGILLDKINKFIQKLNEKKDNIIYSDISNHTEFGLIGFLKYIIINGLEVTLDINEKIWRSQLDKEFKSYQYNYYIKNIFGCIWEEINESENLDLNTKTFMNNILDKSKLKNENNKYVIYLQNEEYKKFQEKQRISKLFIELQCEPLNVNGSILNRMFRKLSSKYHPDREGSTHKFQEFQKKYEEAKKILNDKEIKLTSLINDSSVINVNGINFKPKYPLAQVDLKLYFFNDKKKFYESLDKTEQHWIQCDNCRKWRNIDIDFPSKKAYFCYYNSDSRYDSCLKDEEKWNKNEQYTISEAK